MDPYTDAVNPAAAEHVALTMRQVMPTTFYALVQGVFEMGAPTADIGCGRGENVAWLNSAGYPTTGYDGNPAMVAEARSAYPDIDVQEDRLPNLARIADASYRNVLCAATHVPREDLITAALNLTRILTPGGHLVLAYRKSPTGNEREADSQLFTPIPPGKLALLFESVGLQVIRSLEQVDTTRSDVRWHVLVAEKSRSTTARGLERIERVLVQDRKDTTYKFALLRALCAVSRTEAQLVQWRNGMVHVPLWSLAQHWLEYYWPILTAPTFVAQKHGERPGSPKPVKFRKDIEDLARQYGPSGLYGLLRALETTPQQFRWPLKRIAATIRDGPVTHTGTSATPLFSFTQHLDTPHVDPLVAECGWVAVPESIWMDISRFDHWIEDSIALRWAQLSVQMNPGLDLGEVLTLLLARPSAEHDTRELRVFFEMTGSSIECVWSGATVGHRLHIDHAIPYSVWGNNDVWNLLPCLDQLNGQKSDALPTQALLVRRKDVIIMYWQQYAAHWGPRFHTQLLRALGGQVGKLNWEREAFAGLQEIVEQVAMTRGVKRWEP